MAAARRNLRSRRGGTPGPPSPGFRSRASEFYSSTVSPCPRGEGLIAKSATPHTTFEVPEDRARPDGRKIKLNIAWLPAYNEADASPDPLFLLAGGPGQSAVETFPAMNPMLKEVRERRHILLVDQRGTGKSNLLSCAAPEGGEDDFDASPEAMQAQAAKCAQALSDKADLRHYTTTHAIADLEAVRKAIGADALPIQRESDRLCFSWFPPDAAPEEIHAYTQLVIALCDMAKKQKRVTAKEKAADSETSEKFAFRCFLLRLGFIGLEYASARKLLLQGLPGDSSFKAGKRKDRDDTAPEAPKAADSGAVSEEVGFPR